MNDRLQQLALFVRVVESGSFSKAAREFGQSQPSVSRAMAALERRLTVKLLVRTTRQVSATDAGEALLARARDALLAIDDAENAARGPTDCPGCCGWHCRRATAHGALYLCFRLSSPGILFSRSI